MTKFYQATCAFFTILLIAGCSSDDPLPLPVPNFSLDPGVVEVGIPVMFDNLSINASRYEWQFGDSTTTSTEISPSVTFTSPGSVTVTLTAFTEDDQMVETTQSFTVRERVLTGYIINSFPITNAGAAWDPGAAGAEQFADILVQLVPDDPDNTDGLLDGIFANAGQGGFGNVVDPATFKVVLSDEDWTLIVYDFDGTDPANITQEDVTAIIGVGFNPVQANTIKNDAGDAGFISVLLFDQSTNETLDVDITFQLE